MIGTILNSWALFSGFGLIMLAHALQGTLLNINAVLYDFSDFEIGYTFTGYLLASYLALFNVLNLLKMLVI